MSINAHSGKHPPRVKRTSHRNAKWSSVPDSTSGKNSSNGLDTDLSAAFGNKMFIKRCPRNKSPVSVAALIREISEKHQNATLRQLWEFISIKHDVLQFKQIIFHSSHNTISFQKSCNVQFCSKGREHGGYNKLNLFSFFLSFVLFKIKAALELPPLSNKRCRAFEAY